MNTKMTELLEWLRIPQVVRGPVTLTLDKAADIIEATLAEREALLTQLRDIHQRQARQHQQLLDDFHATAVSYREMEKELANIRIVLGGYPDSCLVSLADAMARRLEFLEAEDESLADVQAMFNRGTIIGENQCMSKDGTDQD